MFIENVDQNKNVIKAHGYQTIVPIELIEVVFEQEQKYEKQIDQVEKTVPKYGINGQSVFEFVNIKAAKSNYHLVLFSSVSFIIKKFTLIIKENGTKRL